MVNTLTTFCHTAIQSAGRLTAWLTLAMVLLTATIVVLRYGFDISHIWHAELVRYFHAFVFLAGAGYTWQAGSHVRVDLFYNNGTTRRKAWIDLLGTIFFLIPVCASLLYFSYGFIADSWTILEASREPGGMPGVFLFKSFLWLFALSLLLQAIHTITTAIQELRT